MFNKPNSSPSFPNKLPSPFFIIFSILLIISPYFQGVAAIPQERTISQNPGFTPIGIASNPTGIVFYAEEVTTQSCKLMILTQTGPINVYLSPYFVIEIPINRQNAAFPKYMDCDQDSNSNKCYLAVKAGLIVINVDAGSETARFATILRREVTPAGGQPTVDSYTHISAISNSQFVLAAGMAASGLTKWDISSEKSHTWQFEDSNNSGQVSGLLHFPRTRWGMIALEEGFKMGDITIIDADQFKQPPSSPTNSNTSHGFTISTLKKCHDLVSLTKASENDTRFAFICSNNVHVMSSSSPNLSSFPFEASATFQASNQIPSLVSYNDSPYMVLAYKDKYFLLSTIAQNGAPPKIEHQVADSLEYQQVKTEQRKLFVYDQLSGNIKIVTDSQFLQFLQLPTIPEDSSTTSPFTTSPNCHPLCISCSIYFSVLGCSRCTSFAVKRDGKICRRKEYESQGGYFKDYNFMVEDTTQKLFNPEENNSNSNNSTNNGSNNPNNSTENPLSTNNSSSVDATTAAKTQDGSRSTLTSLIIFISLSLLCIVCLILIVGLLMFFLKGSFIRKLKIGKGLKYHDPLDENSSECKYNLPHFTPILLINSGNG